MRGVVRKIIRQSTVDGPGNRAAIFLQGCNIRCAYCHNPETQAICRLTDDASQRTDDEIFVTDSSEVIKEIKQCMPFIRGITISGGECMLQAAFVEEIFRAIKPLGLSCLIDSNGTIPFAHYPELLDLCDGVMLDVKAWDSDVYYRLTGAKDNSVVKQNLLLLLQKNKLTEVRIVCLPQECPITIDVDTILHQLAEIPNFISQHVPVRLLRFRPHGVIGELSNTPMPSDEQMQNYYHLAQQLGLYCAIK